MPALAQEIPVYVDLYDWSYAAQSARIYREVRQETYGVDLGQTGWMTEQEFRCFFELLNLSATSRVVEIGCGAGGCAVYLAQALGARVTGIDINAGGIHNARELARSAAASSRAEFLCIDAGKKLPFKDNSVDAVFSNDAMCHIPCRLKTLREWYRLLRPGGRMLFTDAMIVTGMLSDEEIATRSSIGSYSFLPSGENERLIRSAGFELLSTLDLTASAARIALRWFNARARRRRELLRLEGEQSYSGLQQFLSCVHTVSREGRLSRFLYLACKT
jgi:SAM-dependent methyltransferase